MSEALRRLKAAWLALRPRDAWRALWTPSDAMTACEAALWRIVIQRSGPEDAREIFDMIEAEAKRRQRVVRLARGLA